MDGIYEVSSSRRVKRLNRELEGELRDLQTEIEECNFLTDQENRPESFSSFQIPKGINYFKNQRKFTIKNYLQIREAKPLQSHADVMDDELKSCLRYEYNQNSLPLLLHQFYLKQVKELSLLKHLHMLRWARFCQHTNIIEVLKPEYSKRMNELVLEYQDSLERARRLSSIHEAYVTNSPVPISLVKNEDILIYTRWLIYHFHAVKKIQMFLQCIHWIPQTYVQLEILHDQIDYRGVEVDTMKENASSIHFLVDNQQSDELKTESSFSFILSQCTFQTPKEKVNFSVVRTLAAWKQKAAIARERGILRKYKPMLSSNVGDFAAVLNFLLSNYKIGMSCSNLCAVSDEIDMFSLVFVKFQKVHFQQEHDRTFPIYGTSNEIENSHESDSNPVVYKKESSWLPYRQIKPDLDRTQIISLTKLKQQNHIDELLYVQSRIFYVESSDKILHLIKEFVKQIKNDAKVQPTNVSSYRKGKQTKDIWKKLFNSSNTHSSKMEVLEFDSRVKDDNISSNSRNSSSIKLSQNNDGEDDKNALSGNGFLLSLMLLRHLKIKDYRQNCLCILNYFQSIERTLTINDVGLSINNDVMNPPSKHFSCDSDFHGISSCGYLYNTPVDYAIHANDHMESKVMNHDNFYHFKENNIYVQDTHGQYVIYDSAFSGFKDLEEELLLIGSHFLGCDTIDEKFTNEFDLGVYGGRQIDRFGVLLDLWGNEASYLESKRILIDCFMEVYQHIVCAEERKKLAQTIISILYRRPRIDLSAEYFVTSYNLERRLLNLYFQLIKSVVNDHIVDQQAYLKKIHHCEEKQLGLPFKVVEIQNIAVNHSKPVLKNIFMLEFHPSLGIISSITEALSNSFQQMIHEQLPRTTLEQIKLEIYLVEVSLEKWIKKGFLVEGYTEKLRQELLNEVFVEDPLLVSEVGNSLNPLKKLGVRTASKEEVIKMIDVWGTLLEVITYRNRLLYALNESRILVDIYKENALSLGLDTSHAFVRPSSFERTLNESAKVQQFTTNKFIFDESKVDKFSPTQEYLAMSDLDEKHMSLVTFGNEEGLIGNMQKDSVEKLRLSLLMQICHKNLFISLLHQIQSCRNDSRFTFIASLFTKAPNEASKKAMIKQVSDKLKKAFVSVQGEKIFHRDNMLHDFVKRVEKKGLQRSEEFLRVKIDVIQTYCLNLHKGFTQYSLRAQIIAYNHSLLQLLSSFPVIRDSHFMKGDENETKKNLADELIPEPDHLKKRPRKFLSDDGKQILNLWFITHFNDVLVMYQDFDDDICTSILKLILKLTSSLHDICQYLCAYARSGSLYFRRRKGKVELSNDTADWGGAEGIGSELREIQRQIDQLDDPTDPEMVSEFLISKRDLMFLEYDITINHTVPNHFLASDRSDAFGSITSCLCFQKLGNLSKPLFLDDNLQLPEPLSLNDSRSSEYFPWRRFISLYGHQSSYYRHFYNIAAYMQLPLIGLADIDKRIVHGELLGVGLLLEEVLSNGQPYIPSQEKKTSIPKNKKDVNPTNQLIKKESINKSPIESMKFLKIFLKRFSQLEKVKQIWACQRLHVPQIDSTKLYKSFLHIFNTEVVQQIYKRFASTDDLVAFEAGAKEVSNLPSNLTEYEMKIYQLCRLLENLEIMMVQDCIRKISRENTQVVAEKSRADHMLPTDLWKKANMKENVSIQRPHLVEKFIDDLQIERNDEMVKFDRHHFDRCLVKLANACSVREKACYLNYSTFYENLLRHQNQLLYNKEQEIKQLSDSLESNKVSTAVEVDCRLADKSFELIIEVTALRAKVNNLQNLMAEKESSIKAKLRDLYEDLVHGLFDNSFRMVNNLDKFQCNIYNDVMDALTNVRQKAVEKMKNVQQKYGAKFDDSETFRLINAEKLRDLQSENSYYVAMMKKLKNLYQWKTVKDKSLNEKQMRNIENVLFNVKEEKNRLSSIHEEKEKLMNEEKNELTKLLVNLERESDSLRKQLVKEQKIQAQKTHTQLQEQKSLTHIRTAKASSWEKLESGLTEKEKELQTLKDNNHRDREQSARTNSELRRHLKQLSQQMQDERKMKQEAYGRVDDLQNQIVDLESQITNMLSKNKANVTHETCFPLVPGGGSLPNRPKSRSQQITRPKSSIPYTQRPLSSRPLSSRPSSKSVKPILRAKSEMLVSGSNWSPFGRNQPD